MNLEQTIEAIEGADPWTPFGVYREKVKLLVEELSRLREALAQRGQGVSAESRRAALEEAMSCCRDAVTFWEKQANTCAMVGALSCVQRIANMQAANPVAK
jgi:hypothetical protein